MADLLVSISHGDKLHQVYQKSLEKDLYDLFHARELTPEKVAKLSKKAESETDSDHEGIPELRRLHRELDEAMRDA